MGSNDAKSNLRIGNTDNINIGDRVAIVGFPHSDLGRIVLNIQARLGHSGSPVINLKDRSLVEILIGAYVPTIDDGISLGGTDFQTLHQTTHVVSTEYFK